MYAPKFLFFSVSVAFSAACADGEAGLGVDPVPDSSGGAANEPLGLSDYCEVTCAAAEQLNCPLGRSRELCESDCLRIPLPTEADPCFDEKMALARCQYENALTAFECDFAGRLARVPDVCTEETMQAVISCGRL